MKTKGSITDFLSKHRCGHILSEDGRSVYFDKSSLEGLDVFAISMGDWVEFEQLDGAEGIRAERIKQIYKHRKNILIRETKTMGKGL